MPHDASGDHHDAVEQSRDFEAATWLLEHVLISANVPTDRARIRRVLQEAVAAWPGPTREHWWQWLVGSCESLEIKCKVVDCSLEQISTIVRGAGRVIIRGASESSWIAIVGERRGQLHVLQPWASGQGAWLPAAELANIVGHTSSAASARCLVFAPDFAAAALRTHADHGSPNSRHWTPWQRLCSLLSAESLDLWMILLFAFVSGVLALATPLAVETLVNTVSFGALIQPIIVISLMLLAFLTFSAALRALQTYVVELIQRRLFARVAGDLAFRLPRVEAEALDGISAPDMVNRFLEIVTVQKVCAQLLLDGVALVIGALVGMVVLAFYHPWLLGFDLVLLVLIALIIFVLGRGAVSTSIKESKAKYHLLTWLENLASCPTAFRFHGATNYALERTDRMTHDYLAARRSHFRVLLRQILFSLGLQALASTALLGLGGWLVMSGQLTLGQLVAAELIVTVIVGSFAKLGKHLESFYDILASVDKLGMLFDLPIEQRGDGLRAVAEPTDLVAENLSYAVPDGPTVFDGFSLRLGAGESCALSGPSASGKSILLDALFGLRVPTRGQIMLGGVDIRDLRPDTLRRQVALVREIEVFEGAISENVHLERHEVTADDVREALIEVRLLDDLLRLPRGLQTELAPHGHPLTPNQLRKLMLARAIAGRPDILLIDGTLDCLPDDEGEALLQSLADSRHARSLLLVTGRRALIEGCQRQITMGVASLEPSLSLGKESHVDH